MNNFNFDKIQYHRYRQFAGNFAIERMIGFDSEAFVTGEPFLFMDSRGTVYKPRKLFAMLFEDPAKRVDFATWNLRYDSGAVLYFLPYKYKRKLLEEGEVVYKKHLIKYVPHKLLKITLGGKVRNFWDVMPFYNSSLENASSKYLGKHKKEMPSKRFTPNIWRKKRREIIEYCLVDCKRTEELANLLLKTLRSFGVRARTLYSTASVSFQHFLNTCEFVHVWRFWKKYRDLLRFATEAYFGGKFEITARGKFSGYEYDISSAYGFEIANLIDIRYARPVYSKRFESKAVYSFLRVTIDNSQGLPIPCAYKKSNLNIYPAGVFKTTITKAEYEFLKRHKIPVEVSEGWHLLIDHRETPYRKEVERLYKIKEDNVTKNPMLSRLAKTMINSLYGKFVQVTEEPDGTLSAGIGWNPIYAAVITANVRIRLTDLQIKLGRRCLGVHTDSLVVLQPFPRKFLSSELGGWELHEQGEGVLIACGIFQVGEKNANRGFYLPKPHTWLELLKRMGDASTYDLVESRVLSWTGQTSKGKDEDINLFTQIDKQLDLNCELKRVWGSKTNAARLLEGLEFSSPPVVMDYLRDHGQKKK